MRSAAPALFAFLLLASCGRSAPQDNQAVTTPEAPTTPVSFAGAGRDRLCLAGQRAAFITFAGAGDHNCSVRGTLTGGTLAPDGDPSCRIGLTRSGDRVQLGAAAPNCAYYCAAPASFAGKTFVRVAKAQPVTDIAGDPLC